MKRLAGIAVLFLLCLALAAADGWTQPRGGPGGGPGGGHGGAPGGGVAGPGGCQAVPPRVGSALVQVQAPGPEARGRAPARGLERALGSARDRCRIRPTRGITTTITIGGSTITAIPLLPATVSGRGGDGSVAGPLRTRGQSLDCWFFPCYEG